MNAYIAISIIVTSFIITGFLGWNARDAFVWCRAWLYVRFFIKYELATCALGAKVREERA